MVARFEAGARPVSAAHLILLALVLDITVPELVKATGDVVLSPRTSVPGKRLPDLLTSKGTGWKTVPRTIGPFTTTTTSTAVAPITALLRSCGVEPTDAAVFEVARARTFGAERAAAARLVESGAIDETDTDDPESLVAAASLKLWRRSLTDERDARAGSPEGSPGSVAMVKAHVTRRLINDLERFIRSLPRGDAPGQEV